MNAHTRHDEGPHRALGAQEQPPGQEGNSSRDIGARKNLHADVGSGEIGDNSSSVGELFRNRKRHLHQGKDDPMTPPIKMSREILNKNMVYDDLCIQEDEGPSVDPDLAKKIENVFFETSGDNAKLQKIMKYHKHPSNLMSLKPLKLNPEIDSSQNYQSNSSFVMNNEKSLYSSHNFVIKSIAIVSNMANSILAASDADNGGSLDHVNLVKSCMSTITLLSHISAEFTRKRQNNLRNIVHPDYLILCGPKPGTAVSFH